MVPHLILGCCRLASGTNVLRVAQHIGDNTDISRYCASELAVHDGLDLECSTTTSTASSRRARLSRIPSVSICDTKQSSQRTGTCSRGPESWTSPLMMDGGLSLRCVPAPRTSPG